MEDFLDALGDLQIKEAVYVPFSPHFRQLSLHIIVFSLDTPKYILFQRQNLFGEILLTRLVFIL